MIVTGMLVADSAKVVDNKVNVVGGVWDYNVVNATGPQHWMRLSFVFLAQRTPDDSNSSTMTFAVIRPDGSLQGPEEIEFILPDRAENHAIVLEKDIEAIADGRYVFQSGLGDQIPATLAMDVRLRA